MPISTNAPFNEFGQSMILRDIEQLYLALNGAGTGSPGDGQTQDQSEATSQDSGGVPDLSGLATTAYVDAAISSIPSASLYSVSAYGSFTPAFGINAVSYTTISGNASGNLTSSGVFTAPASGLYVVSARVFCTATATPRATMYSRIAFNSRSSPFALVTKSSDTGSLSFTVSGVAPVWSGNIFNLDATAVWAGVLSSGETITMSASFPISSSWGTAENFLYIAGISV